MLRIVFNIANFTAHVHASYDKHVARPILI